MTDEEITKLCAQAMESPPDIPGASAIWNVSVTYEGEERKVITAVSQFYDPLHNDAQAMALVKQLDIFCSPRKEGFSLAWVDGGNLCFGHTLNRAICKCAADVQTEKNKNRLQPGTS